MAGALNVNDLVVLRSDRSGVDALKVTIHRLPANVSSAVTPAQNTYTFWYRPRTEKGDTWITVPELGLHHHHIHRGNIFVSPPGLPVFGEWEGAAGFVVNFSFSPAFFRGDGQRGRTFRGYLQVDIGIISLPSTSGRKPYAGFSWKRPRINARMVRSILSRLPAP